MATKNERRRRGSWCCVWPVLMILTGIGSLALGLAAGVRAEHVSRDRQMTARARVEAKKAARTPRPAPRPPRPSEARKGKWIVNPTTGGSYRVIGAGTWYDGQAAAADQGARLVTIDNATEQKWLVDTFGGGNRYWIGLTDAHAEGDWRWAGGERPSYTNWARGEPNNSGRGRNEGFAQMNAHSPGSWNDIEPGDRAWPTTRAIIERPANVTSTNMRWKTAAPWKFDITGKTIAATGRAGSVIPTATTFDADLGEWRRWFGGDRRRSHIGAEIVWDRDLRSNVVQFTRVGGGSVGSHVGIVRDVNIDVSQHGDLRLQMDVQARSGNLSGGGHAGGSEYPVCVELAYIDEGGTPHRWHHGFYFKGADRYAASSKLPRGAWHRYTSPPLSQMTPLCADRALTADHGRWFPVPMHEHDTSSRPATITHAAVFGGGWDFSGRVDNLRFVEVSADVKSGVVPIAGSAR